MTILGVISMLIAALVFSQKDQNETLNSLVLVSIVAINIRFLAEWVHSLLHLYSQKRESARCILRVFEKILCKRKTPSNNDHLQNESKERKVEENFERSLPSVAHPIRKRKRKGLLRRKTKNKSRHKSLKKTKKFSRHQPKEKPQNKIKCSKTRLEKLRKRENKDYEEAKIATSKEYPTASRFMERALQVQTNKAVYIDADISERGDSSYSMSFYLKSEKSS